MNSKTALSTFAAASLIFTASGFAQEPGPEATPPPISATPVPAPAKAEPVKSDAPEGGWNPDRLSTATIYLTREYFAAAREAGAVAEDHFSGSFVEFRDQFIVFRPAVSGELMLIPKSGVLFMSVTTPPR